MLTEQQSNDYNIWQHELESNQIWLNSVNDKLNKYNDMVQKMATIMKTWTPEQIAKVKELAPRILENYNAAKLDKQRYENGIIEAQSKVNEYTALANQQPTQQIQQTKRRTIAQPSVAETPNNTYQTSTLDIPWYISTRNWVQYTPYVAPVNNTLQSSVNNSTLPWWISTKNWPRYVNLQ